MPDAPMPGMPIKIGDPGVFACKINDGAPVREPAIAGVGSAHKRADLRLVETRLTGVWLVLTLCPHCNAKSGRYCHLHNGYRAPASRR